ncbi:MAG: regulatory protein RecX [Planctomycetota bacterium]|nr:regulatory protein RecX [Planctomycetota bacterium]
MPTPLSNNLFPDESESVVTALVPLPSDPNILSIRVDGRARDRLRLADIESLGLKVGLPWTPELSRRIERAKTRVTVRRAAFRFLGRRSYAKAELKQRLTRHEPDESIVDEVIEELESEGWLDDEAFARQVVESLCRTREAGPTLILQRLLQKGIEEDLALRIAQECTDECNSTDSAFSLAQSHLIKLGSVPPKTAIRRLASLLARRGYDEETIEMVIGKLGLPSSEDQD